MVMLKIYVNNIDNMKYKNRRFFVSKERKFVDGVESISFMEGMVHLELFNYIAASG